ncbi:hypothetical protein CLIM01_03537 [Colletotrichum limetticola]|uniref:Uncharacterized protein n=1 Tax=Colletotrichum limetticola TaxID=1209924 RepID=A0ABQ9Q5N5_9PEZI|nr:hypothetical protein CLIM01_03537 [Colletotrichum limetticola]
MTGSGSPLRLPTTSIISREKRHVAGHERQKKKRRGGFRRLGLSRGCVKLDANAPWSLVLGGGHTM